MAREIEDKVKPFEFLFEVVYITFSFTRETKRLKLCAQNKNNYFVMI